MSAVQLHQIRKAFAGTEVLKSVDTMATPRCCAPLPAWNAATRDKY
jgi:hypothetical protein